MGNAAYNIMTHQVKRYDVVQTQSTEMFNQQQVKIDLINTLDQAAIDPTFQAAGAGGQRFFRNSR